MSAIETVMINDLILETHMIKRETICVHPEVTMDYFDMIIRNHVIWNGSRIWIEEDMHKLHCMDNNKWVKNANEIFHIN